MNYWNKAIETMPLKDIKALQLKLLKKNVSEMYETSKFYHDKMVAAGVKPADIRTLDDLRKLPTMKKSDLRENYPDKLFVRPYSEILRYHVSSGTTGKPTVV